MRSYIQTPKQLESYMCGFLEGFLGIPIPSASGFGLWVKRVPINTFPFRVFGALGKSKHFPKERISQGKKKNESWSLMPQTLIDTCFPREHYQSSWAGVRRRYPTIPWGEGCGHYGLAFQVFYVSKGFPSWSVETVFRVKNLLNIYIYIYVNINFKQKQQHKKCHALC